MGETDYIECHGTGTSVGDPIEVQAVSRVFSEHRQERLLIGAVSRSLSYLITYQWKSNTSITLLYHQMKIIRGSIISNAN